MRRAPVGLFGVQMTIARVLAVTSVASWSRSGRHPPAVRATLLERTRGILRANVPRVEAWLRHCGHGFEWATPEAGAFIYARYGLPVGSTALTERLREEESVLIVPGDAFGMDGYLRLGVGEHADYVLAGLDRLKAFLDRMVSGAH